MKLENENLNEPQKQQLNIPVVSSMYHFYLTINFKI